MSAFSLIDMKEATRLTRAGRLMDATTLIQTGLRLWRHSTRTEGPAGPSPADTLRIATGIAAPDAASPEAAAPASWWTAARADKTAATPIPRGPIRAADGASFEMGRFATRPERSPTSSTYPPP